MRFCNILIEYSHDKIIVTSLVKGQKSFLDLISILFSSALYVFVSYLIFKNIFKERPTIMMKLTRLEKDIT